MWAVPASRRTRDELDSKHELSAIRTARSSDTSLTCANLDERAASQGPNQRLRAAAGHGLVQDLPAELHQW